MSSWHEQIENLATPGQEQYVRRLDFRKALDVHRRSCEQQGVSVSPRPPCRVETPRDISLFVANMHSAADHENKDRSKFLKAEQRKFIADAVKIAPLQTASELIRNVQTSPTKAIDPKLKNSVRRLIMTERKKLHSVTLEGIEVTDQIGPLLQFTDRIWFPAARKAHVAGVQQNQPTCIPLHKVFCIGRAFNSEEMYTMLAFATPWNLLNYFRAVGSVIA